MWKQIKRFDDPRENVAKFVFEKDDVAVESVLYRYPTYEERTVICCSVMSGCPVGCRFCGTGDFFVRSLSAEEIVSQPVHLLQNEIDCDPTTIKKLQIMVMSMGEPLLNKNLDAAFRDLYHRYPNAALLVSSIGPHLIAGWGWFRQLSVDVPTVGLQFSVHESTDEKRNKLIPFKKKMTLKEIAATGNWWSKHTGRRPFFNYCAHGENTSDEDASRLFDLFDPSIWEATVSVICERDQVAAKNDLQRSLAVDFSNKLLGLGYNVRVFDPAGMDTIGGGCGQLWYVQEWARSHPGLTHPSIGAGMEKVHTPGR
jgi:23S rRNA (adenine2503-C2)-methyltransferase